MYIRIKRTETPEELTHLHGKLPTRDASSRCCPMETQRDDSSRRGPGVGAGAHGNAACCRPAACAAETVRFARAPGTPPVILLAERGWLGELAVPERMFCVWCT